MRQSKRQRNDFSHTLPSTPMLCMLLDQQIVRTLLLDFFTAYKQVSAKTTLARFVAVGHLLISRGVLCPAFSRLYMHIFTSANLSAMALRSSQSCRPPVSPSIPARTWQHVVRCRATSQLPGVHSPKNAVLRSEKKANDQDQQDDKQSSPDRPKPSPNAAKRLIRMTGPGSPGGPNFNPRSQTLLLAGHAAYCGLIGTSAIVAASFLNLDLYRMFQWGNMQHMALALALIMPLQIANLAIMGPDYSNWKLPDLTRDEIEETKAALVLPSDPTSSQTAATSTSQQASTTTPADQGSQPQTTSSRPQLDEPLILPRMVTAQSWGQQEQSKPRIKLDKIPALVKDSMFLAQGNYLASNSSGGLPFAAELVVAAVDSISSEMLYRGVLISAIAGWAQGIIYNTGASDMIRLDSFVGYLISACSALQFEGGFNSPATQYMVSVDDLSRWIAGGLVLYLLTWLSFRRVNKAAKKMTAMADIRERIGNVLELQREKMQRIQKLTGGDKKQPASEPSTGSSLQEEVPSSLQQDTANKGSSNQPPVGMSGSWLPQRDKAPLGSSETDKQQTGSQTKKSGVTGADVKVFLSGPGGFSITPASSGNPETAFNSALLATALQASRDLLQGSTLSLLFVATSGNLAACFLASFVNQAIFTALQRLGTERTRKRSAVMAEQLEEITTKMRRIAEKTAAEKKAKAAAAADQAMAEAELSNMTSAFKDIQSDTTPECVSSPATSSVASEHADQQPAVPQEPPVPNTKMARTLSMLDMLVPDPTKQAGKSGSSKQ